MRNGETAYVVWYDNGEPYDDNVQDAIGVFATYDEAVARIESDGFAKNDPASSSWERYRGVPYETEFCSIREFVVGGGDVLSER